MKKIFKRIVGFAIALFLIVYAVTGLVLTLLNLVPESHVTPIAVTVMLAMIWGVYFARDGYSNDNTSRTGGDTQ